MEINVNVSIKRYLEVELNKLEEEKTKLDGRLEDITRQINLYEQLIATYDHVEEEVKKIAEPKIKHMCGDCEFSGKSAKAMPCNVCHNHDKWTEKDKPTAEQVFVTQELTNHFCAEPKPEEKKKSCFNCGHGGRPHTQCKCVDFSEWIPMKNTTTTSVSSEKKDETVKEKKEKPTVEQFVEKNAEHIKKIVSKGTKYTPTILRIIDSYGEPMTATEIATVMGTHQSKIHGALQIMTRDRLLTKSGFKYDIRKKEVKSNV